MGDMGDDFRKFKKFQKKRNAKNLEKAQKKDDGSWIKHTTYHWSKMLNNKKLDYWPSKNKWMYDGKVSQGDIQSFMNKRQKGV